MKDSKICTNLLSLAWIASPKQNKQINKNNQKRVVNTYNTKKKERITSEDGEQTEALCTIFLNILNRSLFGDQYNSS